VFLIDLAGLLRRWVEVDSPQNCSMAHIDCVAALLALA